MPTWLAVATGGALGTLARYAVGLAWARPGAFPWWTLAINISGSFVLGVVTGIAAARETGSTTVAVALSVGLCGGFTTFSAFSVESLGLIEQGAWTRASAYAILSVLLGIAAAGAGLTLIRTRILA